MRPSSGRPSSSRPSTTNSKRPLINDKLIPIKKPVVVKCFVCNQMFHSQESFDSHMDQHRSSMINRPLSRHHQLKPLQTKPQEPNKKQQIPEIEQNNQLYLTEAASNTQPKKIIEQENTEVRLCSQCLDMIGFGKICIVYGDQFFHKECFQ